MYLDEATKEPYRKELIAAMVKEVTDRVGNGNYSIIPKSQVSMGATILPAVCQMKQNRDIKTRDIKKYKARLNIDGSMIKK